MIDRQSNIPGRIKITWDDGTVQYGIMERADEPTAEGTPLNKGTLFNSDNEERYACNLPSEAFSRMAAEMIVTVPMSGWSSGTDSSGWYTNQVQVPEMKKVFNPIMDIVVTGAEDSTAKSTAYNAVQEVETFDGYVIFKGDRIPADDFTVKFRGV